MAAKLKVIDGNAPPRPLGKHGRDLWRSICAEYAIDDSCGKEMLAQACAALDRAEACAAQIDEQGEIGVVNGVAVKDHPLLRHEIANRSFVVRTLEHLGLNREPAKSVGRPTESWSRTHANPEVESA